MKRLPLQLALVLFAACCYGQGHFTSLDIGARVPAGKTVTLTNGYDLTSSTGDVWDYADNFRFLYQQVTGDFDIRVRLQGLSGVAYWTKAGLMVRGDLSDYSQNGLMSATRSAGWGRYFFTSRPGDLYPTFSYFQGSFTRVPYPNASMRMVRIGNNIMSQHSTNGLEWTQVGNLDFVVWPRVAYVGMAVANHPDSGTTPATAQFREVDLALGSPGAPVILTQPRSQTANVNAQVTLSVTAVGSGSLDYRWFREGIALPGATNTTYVIGSVGGGDAGKYTCLVQSEFGSLLSWAAELEVTDAHEPWDGILAEFYNRVYGGQIAYLINATNYPDAPFSTSRPLRFEISSSPDDTGGRIRGFVTPPLTGDYTFYIASDERGELWLSADDNPAEKRLVAECFYYVGARDWDYYPDQISAALRLEAGQRYYVEAMYKGEGAPNHCSVAWRLPNGTLEGPIPAARFRGLSAVLRIDPTVSSSVVKLLVSGTANTLYVMEASSDLSTWVPVSTNRVPFAVERLPGGDARSEFYRARSPQ